MNLDLETFASAAAIIAPWLLVIVSLALAHATHQAARAERDLAGARNRIAILERLLRLGRKPGDYPPGTIPVELALAVHEEWRKAGYHMVGDTRVVLRLLSIAHRVMCQHTPHSLAPALYNDGDRSAPARVACQAHHAAACRYPACGCVHVDDPVSGLPDNPRRKP